MEIKYKDNSLTIADQFQQKIKEERRNAKLVQIAPLIILAVLIFIFGMINKDFASLTNFNTILNQLAIPLILALGMTFVILMGSIDLSVDGVMGLSGAVISLLVLNSKTSIALGPAAIVLVLLLGGAIGYLTGKIYVKGRIPSFMLSFSMSSIAAGIGLLTYQGIPATIKDPLIIGITSKEFLGINVVIWISLAVFVIAYIIQEYTAFGRYVFAIGDNESIPKAMGVNIERVKILAFMWSGLCIALAGIIGASKLGTGTVMIGVDNLFPAITAVIVGGTSLSGGKGGVVNSLLGALIVTVLQNGLILAKVSPFIQTGINGLIIIAAVALSVSRGKRLVTK
jgi:ribose transport system permease protein